MLLHLDDVAIIDSNRIEHRVENVLSTAQNELDFNWFDWWAVGGRWEHWLTETLSKDIWPNQLESRTAIQITEENKRLVLKLLDEVDDIKDQNLERYITQIVDNPLTLVEYLREKDIPKSNHFSWRVRQALNIKDNDWGFESVFVDSEHWYTASTDDLRTAINGSENLYDNPLEEYALVVVDFHH
jgi:hypothetical protein